jgi:hypothetical protein
MTKQEESRKVLIVFAVQGFWIYLLRPLLRFVKYVLDLGAQNLWMFAFIFLAWYTLAKEEGLFDEGEAMFTYLMTEISVLGFPVRYYQILMAFMLWLGVIWLYREIMQVWKDLVALTKRVIARALLVALYLWYRVNGQESEAVYYLNGPPSLGEKIFVGLVIGAALLLVGITGYLEVVSSLNTF